MQEWESLSLQISCSLRTKVQKARAGDHVHLLLSIPSKFSVANTVTGFHFWARSYCVSSVGLHEEKVRACIREKDLVGP
jgi:REP element-mobilizing transposase RayT